MSVGGKDWFASAPVHFLTGRYEGEVSIEYGLDPDVDLLLERPDRMYGSDEQVRPIPLHGVSGALVWAVRGWNGRGIWTPRLGAVIAGHQVQATPTGYIRVRRGIALARLLQQAAPEIAGQVGARLGG
jgi:hypothetical protein